MKVNFLAVVFLFLGFAAAAASVDGVRLSKQARDILNGDICARSAVASVRNYISDLNDTAGTDIPDGGYPRPYVKQVLAHGHGLYSVLVTNYQLPTLNVKTENSSRGCRAGIPYTEDFFPGR